MQTRSETIHNKWELLPGNDFEKALALLREYAGISLTEEQEINTGLINRFCNHRLFANHSDQVATVIRRFYGPNGLIHTKPELCSLRFLMNSLTEALHKASINPDGELQAILNLIQDKLSQQNIFIKHIPPVENNMIFTPPQQEFVLENISNDLLSWYHPRSTKFLNFLDMPPKKEMSNNSENIEPIFQFDFEFS